MIGCGDNRMHVSQTYNIAAAIAMHAIFYCYHGNRKWKVE